MRRILLLSLLGGCEESAQHREARLERERRFARGDCLHVTAPGECTSVVGICPSGDISATYHCASDALAVEGGGG